MTDRRSFIVTLGTWLALPWPLLSAVGPKEAKKEPHDSIRSLIPARSWVCPQCSGRRVLMGEVGSRRLRCPVCEGYYGEFVHEDEYSRFLRELRDNVKALLEQESGTFQRLWIDPAKDGRRLVHLVVSGGRELTWFQNYKGA